MWPSYCYICVSPRHQWAWYNVFLCWNSIILLKLWSGVMQLYIDGSSYISSWYRQQLCCETWILLSLNLLFLCFCPHLCWSWSNFPMNDMYCLGVYVYAFYPIPWLYIQIEHKLACPVILSTFSREAGRNNIFRSLQVSDKIQNT